MTTRMLSAGLLGLFVSTLGVGCDGRTVIGTPETGSGGAPGTGGVTGIGGATGTGGVTGIGGASGIGGAPAVCGAAGNGGAPIDAAVSLHKRVFASRPGQIPCAAVNGNLGGLVGADRICQGHADYEQIGGTWKAWLSDDTTNAIDRIADVGPWYTTQGELAFADKAAMTGIPATPIIYDELGSAGPAPSYWTGTLPGGTRAAANCENWTSSLASSTGVIGIASEQTVAWTDYLHPSTCNIQVQLLCVEQ